ncbi:MAG: hypothetical protein BWY83_01771 [bacterium ADurb.Bin478]|nr:MAG: hypothetical protein BWY83_01771 [bacterium ADurb.Bin478]
MPGADHGDVAPGCDEQQTRSLSDDRIRITELNFGGYAGADGGQGAADDHVHGGGELKDRFGRPHRQRGQQIIGPSAEIVDHHAGAYVKGFATHPVHNPSAHHPVFLHQQPGGLRIIGELRAPSGGGMQIGEQQAFRVVDLRVIPHGAAGHVLLIHMRDELFHPLLGNHVAHGQTLAVLQSAVAVAAQDVVHQHGDRHHLRPFDLMTIGGHQAGENTDEMRSDAHDRPAFDDGFTHADEIRMLQIAQAAMNDL